MNAHTGQGLRNSGGEVREANEEKRKCECETARNAAA